MKLFPSSKRKAQVQLSALLYLAQLKGAASENELRLIEHIARYILFCEQDIHSMPMVSLEDAAMHLNKKLCHQLLIYLLVLSCVNGTVDEQKFQKVKDFSALCGIKECNIQEIQRVIDKRFLLLRVDFIRRITLKGKFPYYWKKYNVLFPIAIIKDLLRLFNVSVVDPSLTDKYKALGNYPEGTLAKDYHNYMIKNQFFFPGEKGAAPEMIIPHDLSHILGGYNTDHVGEIQVVSFTNGYRTNNPSESLRNGIINMLIQWGLGISIVNFTNQEIERRFDTELIIKAFKKGEAMNTDLYKDWDYWSVMDQKTTDLRDKYHIIM
ncbi:MAG: hypothetical protein WC785_07240 [Tatlockia sp.]|jgi:hypothetical protein